ncbi:ATP-binding protein [Planobispora siamensis]|uniref:Histidine kinase/HSP90-like ATPase domain-containing protein n=1 Tax=Planobispora siamensis TaxID=936338 RepID=A0A8J3WQ71_9ACTN|nr:ATP-binding protein [Planobispora siamensis]GIH95491.1 hypothetical protein Psi01_61210 [Planobispora siamensis]
MTGINDRHWPITTDLGALRGHVYSHAAMAGLSGERLDNLLIAANEAAINVLEHGGGHGTLSMRRDGSYLTVEVADSVGKLSPQDALRSRPATGASRGFGLWLMGELCDQVDIHQDDEGSRVCLSMRLNGP